MDVDEVRLFLQLVIWIVSTLHLLYFVIVMSHDTLACILFKSKMERLIFVYMLLLLYIARLVFSLVIHIKERKW